jgi:hypothetical protein
VPHVSRRQGRPWQEIEEEASGERDPNRIQQLAEELSRALEERDKHVKRKEAVRLSFRIRNTTSRHTAHRYFSSLQDAKV